jgi:hypothetical protein
MVIGPGVRNLDFSMFKNFRMGETKQLQFRAESFNLTNTPAFGLPGASFGTSQFGSISGTARDPRDIQLSLKFLF